MRNFIKSKPVLKFQFPFSSCESAVNSVCHAPASPNMQSNVITTSEKKKVFVTGSGNIEVTQVSPIAHPPNVMPNITPNITSNVSNAYVLHIFIAITDGITLSLCLLLLYIGDTEASSVAVR